MEPGSGELIIPNQIEILPRLGNIPVEQQRDKLIQIAHTKGIITYDDVKEYISKNAVADILKLRYRMLTDYVKSVEPMMRRGSR